MAMHDLQRCPLKSDYFWEFIHCFWYNREMRAGHFRREVADEIKQLKGTKTCIFNSYLIRQNFLRYRCESGYAIFAWRLTWNYAYSPFNLENISNCPQMTMEKVKSLRKFVVHHTLLLSPGSSRETGSKERNYRIICKENKSKVHVSQGRIRHTRTRQDGSMSIDND